MVTKSELVDAIRSASDPRQFRELSWTGTFGQYLDIVLEQPDVLRRVMGLAAEAAVPVVVHASEPVGHDYPGKGATTPDRLLLLARAFPEVAFIFAHFGGGIPFYALMPEVADSLSNVYFDSAATPYLYRPEVYAVSATTAGADRILFGSDFPLIGQGRALSGARKGGLNDADIACVLGGNAAGLFGMTA